MNNCIACWALTNGMHCYLKKFVIRYLFFILKKCLPFKDFFYVPYSNDAFVSEEEDSTDSEEKTEKKAKKVSLL